MFLNQSESSPSFRVHPSVWVVAFIFTLGMIFHSSFLWYALFWAGMSATLVFRELAKTWAAGKYGISTKWIQIMPLGSVSQQERLSPHPTDNFWIAMMGPLSHIVASLALSFMGGLLVLLDLDSPFILNLFLELILFNTLYAFIQVLPFRGFDGNLIWKSVAYKRKLDKTHLRTT